MAKFTSYYLKGGQLFYAKTGAAVPEKHASNLTVDLAKKTVYKDGRKVGTLRQKTVSKKATDTIERNAKRRPRVPAVDMDAVRKGGKPTLPTEGVKIKLDRDAQGVINFGKAVDELTRLGRLDTTEAQSMKNVYKVGSTEIRTALWDEVHSMFNEYGYQYETVGWTD
jgi:hypothetical protein